MGRIVLRSRKPGSKRFSFSFEPEALSFACRILLGGLESSPPRLLVRGALRPSLLCQGTGLSAGLFAGLNLGNGHHLLVYPVASREFIHTNSLAHYV
jgi:hypothetical protein